MTILVSNDIKELLQKQEPPCVSIYLPTLTGGTDGNQNLVRFKNLLRRGEEELLARGMRKAQVEKLIEPARPLLVDSIYWRRQSEAFAMFISPMLFKTLTCIFHRIFEILLEKWPNCL